MYYALSRSKNTTPNKEDTHSHDKSKSFAPKLSPIPAKLSENEFKDLLQKFKAHQEHRDYRCRQSKLYFNAQDEFQLEDWLPEVVEQKQQ